MEGIEIFNYVMYVPHLLASISPPGDGEADDSRRSLSSTNEPILPLRGSREAKAVRDFRH